MPTSDNRLVFANEIIAYEGGTYPSRRALGSGHTEARLKEHKDDPGIYTPKGPSILVYGDVSSWVVYHCQTQVRARECAAGPINDNEFLRPNAGGTLPEHSSFAYSK